MRLSISYNGYLTDWKLNVEYAETQLKRALKKLDKIIASPGTHAQERSDRDEIRKALERLGHTKHE